MRRTLLFLLVLFSLSGCVSVPEIVLADNLCASYRLTFVSRVTGESSVTPLCTCAKSPLNVLLSAVDAVREKKDVVKIELVSTPRSCE